MSNIPSLREGVQKAAAFVMETRKADPTRSLASILDEAGMRYNLTPLDSEALYLLLMPEASSGGAKQT